MTREQAEALKKRADRAFELMRWIDDAKAEIELLQSGQSKCPITVEYGGDLFDGRRHPKAESGTECVTVGMFYDLIRDHLIAFKNSTITRCEAELKTLEYE